MKLPFHTHNERYKPSTRYPSVLTTPLTCAATTGTQSSPTLAHNLPCPVYPTHLAERVYSSTYTSLRGPMHRAWGCHRPSRLVWFVIGAVSATWFIKSKEAEGWRMSMQRCSRHRIPQEAYHPPPQQESRKWEWTWPTPPPSAAATVGGAAAVPVVHDHAASQSPLPMPQTADSWDEERQRLQKISQQATETVRGPPHRFD